MSLLDRKLLRDLNAMRAQVITIALLVAAGVAVFVVRCRLISRCMPVASNSIAMLDFRRSLSTLKRAPLSILTRLNAVPGIAAVEPRIVRDVIVDWPSSKLPVSARMVSLVHAPVTSRSRDCTCDAARAGTRVR